MWTRRLNGETINPSSYDSVATETDEYYKTNPEYNSAVEELEDTMDGTD